MTNISQKIIYGYAIALSVTIWGSVSGVFVGNTYHQESLQKYNFVVQERKFLSELQLNILYYRPARQLASFLKDPVAFREESTRLLEHIQKIELILEERKKLGRDFAISGLQQELDKYLEFLKEFRAETQIDLSKIEALTTLPSQESEAESLLLKLVKKASFSKFIEFPDQLLPFSQQIKELEGKSELELSNAKNLRNQIAIISLLCSTFISIIFIQKISKAISSEQAKSQQKLQDQLLELQQSQIALTKSEAHQKALVTAIPDLLLRMDREGVYQEVFVNSNLTFVGNVQETLGANVKNILPQDIAQKRLEAIALALSTNSMQIYEQNLYIEGKFVVEEVRIVPCGQDEVLAFIRDISDRKLAEQELKQINQILENKVAERTKELWQVNKLQNLILNTEDYAIITFDLNGVIQTFNAGAEKMLGYRREEVVGISTMLLFHDFQEIADRAKALSIELGREISPLDVFMTKTNQIGVHEEEWTNIHKDGLRFPVSITLTAMKDEQDHVIGYLGIGKDIRDRKKAEEQLKQANQELMRANRLKDEFLATMSHELRTPLNAILGIAEGLQDEIFGTLNAKQMNVLSTVTKSGNHLLALINDILDLSKIEAGKLDLEYSLCNILQLCNSSMVFVKQQAHKKRIRLQMEISPDIPVILKLDERRIRQALINLLNNAVKFTPEGGKVLLEVNVTQKNDAKWVRFSIIDSGIGIDAEGIKILFQPFVQVDSALNRKYEGTGLGLALVKRIVELHDGAVNAMSEVGCGSCFTIDLPYPDKPFPHPEIPEVTIEYDSPQDMSINGEDSLVLLVEDNDANTESMVDYLQFKGYQILIAKNGQEAITLVRSHHPHIVLMDIQMPIMDGFEAIRWIRHNHSSDLPIIAISALAMSGDREKCLAAGASAYFSKPLQLQQLVTTMQELLRR